MFIDPHGGADASFPSGADGGPEFRADVIKGATVRPCPRRPCSSNPDAGAVTRQCPSFTRRRNRPRRLPANRPRCLQWYRRRRQSASPHGTDGPADRGADPSARPPVPSSANGRAQLDALQNPDHRADAGADLRDGRPDRESHVRADAPADAYDPSHGRADGRPTRAPTIVPTGADVGANLRTDEGADRAPTSEPTHVPTTEPTAVPSPVPVPSPTSVPTTVPTALPTSTPTSPPSRPRRSAPRTCPRCFRPGSPRASPRRRPHPADGRAHSDPRRSRRSSLRHPPLRMSCARHGAVLQTRDPGDYESSERALGHVPVHRHAPWCSRWRRAAGTGRCPWRPRASGIMIPRVDAVTNFCDRRDRSGRSL